MKLIKAIIRPECLDIVMDQLAKAGWNKMIVRDVRGRGDQGGIKFMKRGKMIEVPLLDKIEIDIIAYDGKVDKIVEIITKNAKTERGIGDGKIFILPVEKCIRIRDEKVVTEESSNAENGL